MIDNYKDMELGYEMISEVTGGAIANVATLRYSDEIYADAGISVRRKGGNKYEYEYQGKRITLKKANAIMSDLGFEVKSENGKVNYYYKGTYMMSQE
jgi:hypothetical protein